MRKQNRIQSILGRRRLPKSYMKLSRSLAVASLVCFFTSLVPGLKIMPSWYYMAMILILPIGVLAYMLLSWPGSMFASGTILFPYLLSENTKIFKNCASNEFPLRRTLRSERRFHSTFPGLPNRPQFDLPK